MVRRFLNALEVVAKVASVPEQFVRSGDFTIGGKDWREASVDELRDMLGHLRARDQGNGFGAYVNSVSIKMFEERIEEIEQGPDPEPLGSDEH